MAKRYKNKNDEIDKSKPSNKKAKNKILLTILLIIFLALIIFALVNIIIWKIENDNTNNLLENINKEITIDETKEDKNIEKYSINFEELKNKNQDTVGWLKVLGTDIEYPIVQAKNNDYYLTHSYNNDYNSAGWPFADYRNKLDGEDKNIIIYGHNRKDESMFGALKNVFTDEWYNDEKNRKVIFATENEQSIYEVFSIYDIEEEDYYIQTNFTTKSFKEFVDTISKRSTKEFDVQVNENDQVLTLSTCSTKGNRVVLHAKKIIE